MKTTNSNVPPMKTHRVILVIDDDADVMKSIQACLRLSGWTLATTLDAKEGIELARTVKPDVILCDASMPNVSGSRVIETLKNDPATASIPIVLMSGFADAEMFARVPWTSFLPKPFGPQELRAAIESAATKNAPRTE